MVICGTIKAYLKRPCQRRWVQISSPCEGSVRHKVAVGDQGEWSSFCPICKRPIKGEPTEAPVALSGEVGVVGRYAFVVVLWGGHPGYILGAMVLAKSLQKVGTKHELVLLHTSDVPDAAVDLLAKSGWTPRRVEPIDGVREMYNHGEPRFKGVFTKLRALSLCEYEKIICMDIDILVIKNIDHLFNLRAPAANGRGPQNEYNHGDLLDGNTFFRGGTVGNVKSWGQCWGINAGVMLMCPDEDELQQMMLEVLDSRHPSHIKGNGPEQDYLSRYWAKCWSHIGVEYNFQLHQMYHVLHGGEHNDARPRLMRQFLEEPIRTDVHLVHYSGSLKPWHRYLDAEYTADLSPEGDALFLKHSLEQFNGYWLWAAKDPETVKWVGPKEGVTLGPNGKLHWIEHQHSTRRWDYELERYVYGEEDCAMNGAPQEGSTADERTPLLGKELDIADSLVEAAEKVVATTLVWWREVHAELAQQLGAPGQGLTNMVVSACTPAAEQGQQNGTAESQEQYAKTKELKCDNSGKRETSDGWRSHGPWWVQHPVLERASVVAGNFPERFVTVACCGTTLLNVHGKDALGIFGVAISSSSPPSILTPNADVKAWAMQVNAGAAILVAIVSTPASVASEALQCMEASGFEGLPSPLAVPDQCALLVLSGYKGRGDWWEATAAADFAKATVKVPSDVQLCLESPRITQQQVCAADGAMA